MFIIDLLENADVLLRWGPKRANWRIVVFFNNVWISEQVRENNIMAHERIEKKEI